MNIRAVYKCRNCQQQFSDPTIYEVDGTIEGITRVYYPGTSLVYRPYKLDARLMCFHDCPCCSVRGQARRIGIADLIALIPLEESQEPKAE